MADTPAGGAARPDGEARQVGAAVKQGFFWNLLNFAFSQGASIVIFLTLSRAVSPATFGVFALAAVFVDLVAEQGRWASMDAIVQRRDFSPAALASAFFSLLAIGVLLAIAFIVGASEAARIVEEPGVARVLPPLSLALLLMPAIAVMDALIMRRLQFRAQALRSMAGVIVGGAVGLSVAFGPAVEWALVAQRLTALGVTLVVLFAFTRWLPALTFDGAHARAFLRRAVQLWSTTVLATGHWRVTQAAVGIRAGVEALGLLNVAQRFETALHGPITGPIQSLWVPVLSALRTDREESWRLFLRLSQLTALLALPAFVGLGLVGRDLVAVALDERYRFAGDILFVVGMQGFIIPVGFFSNLIFAGLDRSDLSLKFSAAQLCVTVPAVWIAAAHGPVWAQIVALSSMGTFSVIATGVQVRMLGGKLAEMAAAMAPAYLSGLVMTAAVLTAGRLLPYPEGGLRLVCLVGVGVVVYGAWILAFHRKEVIRAWRTMSTIRASGASA